MCSSNNTNPNLASCGDTVALDLTLKIINASMECIEGSDNCNDSRINSFLSCSMCNIVYVSQLLLWSFQEIQDSIIKDNVKKRSDLETIESRPSYIPKMYSFYCNI